MSISVLMSVYHKEKASYLNEALESVWDKQTLKPQQIVLVEDGPLGEPLNALIEMWEKRLPTILTIVKLPENVGLSLALNEGIKYNRCKFIARMDSDDISFPERFQKQYDFLEKNRNILVTGGSIQEIDDDFNILSTRTYPISKEQIRNYIVKACPFAHPTVMFRKEIFDTFKYSEKHRVSQDIELWYKLILANVEMANIPDVILYLRRTEDFYKRRAKDKAIKEFKIYWQGIRNMHGFSWKMIYPLIRLVIRISPPSIVKFFYKKEFRKALNK